MANFGRFYLLEAQTLIFLWSTTIVNFLEIIFYAFHLFEFNAGFWNLIGMSFYLIWTFFAILFCAIGVIGIRKFVPNLLKNHCVLYLLCSAIFKAIFAILLLILSSNNSFYRPITYASSEPLLFVLIGRNIVESAPLPVILSHVIAMFYLVYGAFITHRFGNRMLKRTARIEAGEIPEGP